MLTVGYRWPDEGAGVLMVTEMQRAEDNRAAPFVLSALKRVGVIDQSTWMIGAKGSACLDHAAVMVLLAEINLLTAEVPAGHLGYARGHAAGRHGGIRRNHAPGGCLPRSETSIIGEVDLGMPGDRTPRSHSRLCPRASADSLRGFEGAEEN